MNSSIHSYMVLAFTEQEDVSLNVGFYYMANAMGRVLGTVVSGVLAWAYGVEGCLWGAVGMLVMACVLTQQLRRHEKTS